MQKNPNRHPNSIINKYHLPTYSARVGDCARTTSTGPSTVTGTGLGALPSDAISASPPSTPPGGFAPVGVVLERVFELDMGSGDVVRSMASCVRPSSDSGGRTPPRRKRGVARGLRKSAGGGGGSDSSALLGNHERNVRWDRASACAADVVPGAGLGRVLGVATVPVPSPELEPVLAPALSGTGLQGNSGRRDGKNRRGGTLVVLGERRDELVVGAAASSASGSTTLGAAMA